MICPSCRSENQAGAEVCFHCRAVLGAITRGSHLGGRYEVRDLLGRGGMGLVYEALDTERGETVALKVLRGELLARGDMTRRFRSEVELARMVRHPNVCRIVDGGEDRGRPFVVMERVVGSTLKARLAEGGPLPAAEACAVARQAALGLAAIHSAGIVHRDLKPANLMAERGGHVRVMDFGIAIRPDDDATGPTGSGYAVGSPEYMSPEQARGRPLEARSDLYALGVVLYELLTGRVPFKGDTPVATLLLHLEAAPPLRGAGAFGIPELLVPLLERALAKEPAARFGSAAEMAEALRLAEAGLEGRSRPASPASPAHPAIARSERTDRARVGSWYAVGVLAVAALLGAAWALLRPPAPPIHAPTGPAATVPVAGEATLSGRSSAAEAGLDSGLTPPQAATSDKTGASPPISQGARPEASVGALPRAGPTSAPASGPSAPVPAESGPGGPGGAPPPPDSPADPASLPAADEETPEPASAAPAGGALLVLATPWADVSVDGRVVGQTPLARIPLAEGPHSVLLIHPDYQPYPRRVTIRNGETLRLVVDFAVDGVKRRR